MLLKKLFKFFLLLQLIVFFTSIVSCDIQVSSMGYQQRIFVVADSLLWAEIKPDLLEVFETPIYTPVTENTYEVNWIKLEDINEFKTRMNIFLFGVANEDNQTTEYLEQVLPEQFKQGVAENKYFYVFNDDLFASDQIGLIMYAKDRESFKENFSGLKEEIFKSFSDKYFARLEREMYDKGEQKDIQEILDNNFGWSVRVQHDYFIAIQDVEQKYVWLRRMEPDRWLSMWEIDGDSTKLEQDSLISIRNNVLGKNYQGDEVVLEDTYLSITEFNDEPTRKLVGVWKNDSINIGGPFRMYTVHDPNTSKLHFIDIAVMAPGKLKKPI